MSLVGNFDFLIGVRLHALIFAAVMNVQMTGISYDPKIDRFLETLDERHAGTLKTVTVDNILERAFSSLKSSQEVKDKRAERIRTLRERAFQNAELAMGIIKR
jgi:polysaccharide pyruvyl transferase WcaK-like protein